MHNLQATCADHKKSSYPLLAAISDPADYRGATELGVVLPEESSLRRRMVRRWCEALPGFSCLQYVQFRCHVSQELFEAACRIPRLERLWVKLSGVTSLDAAANCETLHGLHLLDAPKLESLTALGRLQGLRALDLLNFRRVQDISPVGELVTLEKLFIGGGMWAEQRVLTLEPLSRLKKLKSLSLVSIRADDDTLRPLYELSTLERFDVGTRWNQNEIAAIRLRNPGLSQ